MTKFPSLRKGWLAQLKKAAVCSTLLFSLFQSPVLAQALTPSEVQQTEENTYIEKENFSLDTPLTANPPSSTALPALDSLVPHLQVIQKNRAEINGFNLQGLTRQEIIELAEQRYGDYAAADPGFGLQVTTEFGETIDIPFSRKGGKASGTASEMYPYTWHVTHESQGSSWYGWGSYLEIYHIDGKLAYCVEPGVVFQPGAGFTQQTEFAGMTPEQKEEVNLIVNFGAKETDSVEFKVATNFAIWEAMGYQLQDLNLSNYADYKKTIYQNIANYQKKPAIHQKEYTVKVGESLTITDDENLLAGFTLSSTPSFSISHDGNSVTVTPSAVSKSETIHFSKEGYYSGSQYFYVKNNAQSVTTGGSAVPTTVSLKINVLANPSVGTILAAIDGGKEIDSRKEQILEDQIQYKNFPPGPYTRLTKLLKLNEQNEAGEVVFQQTDSILISQSDGIDSARLIIPADTFKANSKYVCFEYYYTGSEMEEKNLFAQHTDATDADQTVYTNSLPIVGTVMASIDGEKLIDSRKENILIDFIDYQYFIPGEYTRVTQLIKLDDTQNASQIIYEQVSEVQIDEANGQDTAELIIPANTFLPGDRYVCFEYYYTEKNTDAEYLFASHTDPKSTSQTVYANELPLVGTELLTSEGGKTIDATVDNHLEDWITYENFLPGTYTRVTQLLEIVSGKEPKIVIENKDVVTIEASSGTDKAVFNIPANTLNPEAKYVCFEYYYTGESTKKEQLFAEHTDSNDEKQTINTEKLAVKEIESEQKKQASSGLLPTTGEISAQFSLIIGLVFLLILSLFVYKKSRKEKS
ncbi:VaFE repeat-containing surface-anchored protein [Enterococcus sp. LJL128]